MGLSEVWDEFLAAGKEWDQSLRDGFAQFVGGDRVIDQITDPAEQDKRRKEQWAQSLANIQKIMGSVCSYDYFEAFIAPGNTAIILSYAMWKQGESVTGIPDSAIPAPLLARARTGKLSPMTREEFNQWRATAGCGPAKELPPGTPPPASGDVFPTTAGAGGGLPAVAALPAWVRPLGIGLGIAGAVLVVGWVAVKLSKRRG